VTERVLVMGWRAGLGDALEGLSVPYAVWNDAPLKRARAGVPVVVQPFGGSAARSRALAARLAEHGPFTHVIAGTERAVVPASHARRALDARRSMHTVAMRCHDKLYMKRALARHGIPMTEFRDARDAEDPLAAWGSPVVLKDRRSSGGRGVELIRSGEELAAAPTRGRLLERFVEGSELSVESFVVDGAVVFASVTEYLVKGHVNVVPLGGPVALAARALAARVVKALRIRWGLTHVELYVREGELLFGEVALRPPGGYLMDAMGLAWGFDAWEAFVRVELGRAATFPDRPAGVAASVIFHPGPGRVTAIDGASELRRHPHVVRLRLRAKVGDVIEPREGVGQDVGHALLRAPDRGALLAAVAQVRGDLRWHREPA
jgi:biotin carboxylase